MSDTTPVSPGVKALRYAEVELGVHSVHGNALEARERLDTVLTELSAARDKKREVEYILQDRELLLAGEERSKHSDMSAAAMDKHMKVVLTNDDEVRQLREQHIKIVGDIEGLEYDKTMAETDIKIAVARMHELGGYFEYLAAIKNT